MKKCRKALAALMSIALLVFGGTITASAAEVPAPFTAQQLLDVVKVQCASVSSVREVLTESVQMKDGTSGKTVTSNLITDIQQSRTAIHTVMAASVVTGGYSTSMSEESYASIENGILSTYNLDQSSGQWKVSYNALTAEQLEDYNDLFGIVCIDAKDAAVTVEGNIVRLRTTLTDSSMMTFTDMLQEAGISTEGASFPVVMEFDAATLLPLNMKISMDGLKVNGMSRVTTTAVAEVTFSEYNQYNDLAVPETVIVNAK